ncbi:MAG: putative sulfate exporter family transporter [Rhodoglobus sp.]|nr:putative sulfate exporter family transporter [Rhodoglobus sp.]
MLRTLPGLALALLALVGAWALHLLVPWAPALTICVVLGIVFAALPFRPGVRDVARPGLGVATRRVLRLGIVLLGFQLSLADVAGLGALVLVLIVAIVVLSFAITVVLGRALGLPGNQPILIAAGFSICGVSAIGAMSAATGSDEDEAATPVALVTLCGTLAIAVLPLIALPLALTPTQFGMWTGASVHDVGQVVATAQIAGATALAVAVVVKLTRVALLAPLVAITGAVLRRTNGARPPIVPLFLLGFLAAVVARTFLPLSSEFLTAASEVQFVLLGMALFGLGAAIRVGTLVRTGSRALAVAGLSWFAIGALSLGAVWIATASGAPILG